MKDKTRIFYCTVRDFLTIYLPKQRGVSPNTVKSYRDALNLLIDYAAASQGSPLSEICFDDISRGLTEGFLMWLEDERKYSVSSRNQRLAAIRSFLKYASEKDKTVMTLYLDIEGIPKRKDSKVREIDFLNESALEAVLAQPDQRKKNGQRDLVFMILMYDTGARVQEMLDLKLQDIRLNAKNPYVVITGKGSKMRHVPVMEKTCRHLVLYFQRFHPSWHSEQYLFYIDRKGTRSQMSIDNVEKFVARYGKKAREISPDVPEHLYPHMWRHSRAMHLYRNGMPLH